MWEKFKESKFVKKMQQIRVNRAVLISVVTVLLSLAIVLAITAALNRSKKPDPNPPIDNETGTEAREEETQKPPLENETDDKKTSVDDVIPTSFTIPVSGGRLAKEHDETLQVFSNTMKDYRVHLGIDVSSDENSPVLAAADGVVTQVWEDALMGTCVAVSHSGDCCTIYKNLASDLAEGIEVGSKVKAGQTIAYVGGSAMVETADEPHLHMEMTVGGLAVNPMEYFDRSAFSSADVYEDETSSSQAGK